MNARHTVLGAAFAVALSPLSPLFAVEPVIAPDDGTGSIDFPVLNTPLVNSTRVRKGMQELKSASQEVQIEMVSLSLTSSAPPVVGGSLGGNRHVCSGVATLAVEQGAALLRVVDIPVNLTVDAAPRSPGAAVQEFDTDVFLLQGELFGDPDFDLLRITGGTDLGLPSPGHSSLARLGPPGSDFAVDSFFDIEYRIEFQGLPGGALEGFAGDATQSGRCEQPLRLANGVPYAPQGDSSVVRTPEGLVCHGGGGGAGGVIRLGVEPLPTETFSLNYEEIRWSYRVDPTSGGLSLPDDGGSLTLDVHVKELDKSSPLLCRSVCTTSGGTLSCTPDFSPLGATGTRVEVWHDGQLVGSAIAPNGLVACSVAARDFHLQAVEIHEGRSSGVRRHGSDNTPGDVVFVKELDKSSPLLCSTPGGDFLGSELRFSPVGARLRVGTIGHVDHGSSVSCVIDDDSVRIFDRAGASPRLRGMGNAGLSKADSKRASLRVSNLGSSGQDGVSIDLGDDGRPPVTLELESFRCGEPSTSGPGSGGAIWLHARDTADNLLGSLACESGGAGGGGRIAVRANFSPTGSPTALVRVVDHGAVVGEAQVPLSGDTEVCGFEEGPDGPPYLERCGKAEGSPPFGLPCFFLEFDRPITVTPSGSATPLVGSRLEILADAVVGPLSSIRTLEFLSDSVQPVHLHDIGHGPDRFPGFTWREGEPVFPSSVLLVCSDPPVFDTTGAAGGADEGLEFRVMLRDLVELGPAPDGIRYSCNAEIAASGVGAKRGYEYYRLLPTTCVMDVGANPFAGEDLQVFPVEMVSLDLTLPPGDPDFAFLAVRCGSGSGLPACPGEVRRTRLPSGDFQVDSFFDITYQLDFQGAPGGPNDGASGSSLLSCRWHMYMPQHIRWGVLHEPVGISLLGSSATGGLTVSNLGSSGQDGVSIDLGGAQGAHVAWEPHHVLPDTSCGVRIVGDPDGQPFGSELMWLSLGRDLVSSSLELAFDASGAGGSSTTMRVHDGVFMTGEVPGANNGTASIAPVGGAADPPPVVAWSVSHCGDGTMPTGGVCATLHFESPVAVTAAGGPPLVGDRVSVCVPQCRVSRFSSMRCVSSDSSGFEISRSSLLWNGRFVSGDDGTRIQCWDGVCRVSGNSCPHAAPYRCQDGTCRISALACPLAAPAPSLRLDVSPRDAASGLPTGKRQHGPMVVSTTGGALESPGDAARVEMLGTAGGVSGTPIGAAELRCLAGGQCLTSVQWPYQLAASTRVAIYENPIHEESGHEGTNPLYEGVAGPSDSPAVIDASSPILLSCVGGAPADHNPLNRPAYLSFCFVHPVSITAPDGSTYQGRELLLMPEDPTAPVVEDLSLLSVSLQIPGFVGGTDEFGVDGVFTGPLWHDGLTHLSQGSCTIESESSERLVVSNIGSSGQDGVSIELGRGEGARLEWEPIPVSLPGASLRCGMGPVGDLNRDGLADLVVTGQPGGGSCVLGTTGMGSTVRVVCRDAHGNAVGDFLLPGENLGTCVGDGEDPQVTVCGTTDHFISDGGSDGPGFQIGFANAVVFSPSDGSGQVTCFQVVAHCYEPGVGYCSSYNQSDWFFECALTGLPDQVLRHSAVRHFRSVPCAGRGDARLLASPGALVVSNIGSSGQDGVRIDLEHAGSFSTGGSGGEDRLTENVSLNFQPVPLTFHLGGGGGAGKVKFSATGSADPAGGPPATLGVCALDTDSDGDSIPIEIDFTDHGVDQAQILILQDGFPVGAFLHGDITFPYVIGSLRSAGGIAPALVGGGAHSSRRVPGGWDGMCYSMRFDEPIEVVFPGDPPGTGFVGNELRVCPGSDVPTPVPSVAGLYAFELTVTDNPGLSSLPQLVITDLPRNDFGAWLQLHFSPQEIQLLAAQNFQGDFDGDGCPDVCEFVEGTDPRVAESPHGRGVGFGTLASPDGSERIRLSYFTADIAGAEVRLRSTLDLDQWNEDPSQFQLIRRDPQPDGRTRWEWEVLAPLGSKSREFYGHVTVLK